MVAYAAVRIDHRPTILVAAAALALITSGCIRSGSPYVNPNKQDAGSKSPTSGTTTGGDDTTDVDTGTDDSGDTGTGDTGDTGDTGSTTGTADTGDDTTSTTGTDTGVATGTDGSVALTIGTWNLHNFSKYGTSEFRIDDIADMIQSLDVDVLAVQELKVKDGSNGGGEQAWDVLLEKMPDYDGVHAPWDTKDSTVGLIWRKSTTTLNDWEVVWESDWSAFPRPPIIADVTVTGEKGASTFKVIVLHLKAFKDDVDRRREACEKMDKYIAGQADKRYVMIGDFNDDPYDPPAKNAYVDTFLDAEPDYYFVTQQLPLGTVTSTGYGTDVNGDWKDGEFLDHAILTGDLYSSFESVTAEVKGKPESEFSAWKKDYSDHFPVLVHLVQ